MLDSYEFEGKTKEEATRKACKELEVSEEQLEIEVLSYGSTGIFGLVGAKKARIRVSLLETPEAKIDEEKPDTTDETEGVAETAKRTLEDILSFILDDATVTVAKHPHSIRLKIEASNPAILIGRHGRTLDALQYIVRKIVRKKKATRVGISFDVEGYRDRRKASLTQFAQRLGEKVKHSGKPATISPMNAYDRRIVHIALKDDASVRTQSKGTGLFRKLIILPQKKR
ncbi:MAG: protein jag [Desulfobacterales bacterium]|nr:protein jag [Desulfobacterales bacterium]